MSNEINLFLDGHVFDHEFQGTRTFLKELYSALLLNNNNLKLTIGSNNIEKIRIEFADYKNVKFIKYKFKNSFVRIFIEIPYILYKGNFDFAHFQYLCPFYKIKQCKFIITIHDILFNDYKNDFGLFYRLIRNYTFRKSCKYSIVTTVSEYSKNVISKCYSIDADDIYVIPNAVNKNYFINIDKAYSRIYIKNKFNIDNFILYVSRIEPRKNHELILESYIKLKLWEKGICLIFIGKITHKNSKFEKLLNKIKNEDYFNRIKNYDDINEYDLIQFYRACKIFIYPSKAEGFGIPPLEAAISLAPVLCSNSTAMSDYSSYMVSNFNPYDLNELNIAILKYIDFDNLDLLKINANKLLDKYNWQESAKVLIKLLNNNLKNKQVDS